MGLQRGSAVVATLGGGIKHRSGCTEVRCESPSQFVAGKESVLLNNSTSCSLSSPRGLHKSGCLLPGTSFVFDET